MGTRSSSARCPARSAGGARALGIGAPKAHAKEANLQKGEFPGAAWAPRSRAPARDAGSSKAEQRLRSSSRRSLSVASPAHILPMRAPFLSSLHPSSLRSLWNTPFSGNRGCAGSGAWVPLSPEARGPPSGLAVLPHSVPSALGQGAVCSLVEAPAAAGQPATLDTDRFRSQLGHCRLCTLR